MIMIVNNTLDYYNQNAQSFADSTMNVEFSEMQDVFLSLIPAGGYILDFGCGSGRDAKYFLDKGYRVDATDGSEEMVRIACEHTRVTVRQMLFNELDEICKYDGIWACSSILHLELAELQDVMSRIRFALKRGGVLYTSFKYGTFAGERNGRFFTDMTQESLGDLIDNVGGLDIIKLWITSDVRPGRENEKWLNVLLRKTE